MYRPPSGPDIPVRGSARRGSEFDDIVFSALGESMLSSDVHPRFFAHSLL